MMVIMAKGHCTMHKLLSHINMIQALSIDIETTKDGMNIVSRAVKRGSDIVFSFFGMLLLSPVYLYICIKLLRQKEGPVFFRQERIGKGGEPFYILKFSTMSVSDEPEEIPLLAKEDDVRITRVGKFLRDHHLDELPQLWNVFVGDMSFVGPRPERQYFIEKIMEQNSDYEKLYQIRPGITSMASIYNGYTDTMEKMLIRLQMDLEYLQKRSLWLDAKIIFTTIKLIINGKKF